MLKSFRSLPAVIQGREVAQGGDLRFAGFGVRRIQFGLDAAGALPIQSIERIRTAVGGRPAVGRDRARRGFIGLTTGRVGSQDDPDGSARSEQRVGGLSSESRTPAGCRPAGSRKKDPPLIQELSRIIEPETGGDPEGKRKFVRLSLRSLSRQLGRICHVTVGRLLQGLKFSLKTNVKRLTGPPHPDRDRQFRFIKKLRSLFERTGAPVISVDTKNSVLIGNFKNRGARYCRTADEVLAHDFPSDAECRAVPYGIYDVARNRGHVCVGTSSDTGEFAVNSIRDWWARQDKTQFANSRRLWVLCDSGGSNGCRPRLWKRELQRFADESGMTITVAHYPRGASKWNPIEHRLFSQISANWAGHPLRSLAIMLGFIQDTTTQTGLTVTATQDRQTYKCQIKVSPREMKQLNIRRQRTCPQWNYTISPRPPNSISGNK